MWATSWSNLYQAYDDLSARAKRRVESLERWTLNPHAAGGRLTNIMGKNQRYFPDDLEPVMHPLVRTHPQSGRKALYVSHLTTGIRGIRGVAASWRARRLLRRLQRHVARPHLYCTHRWRPGDLVIWDNLCTNHKREAFGSSTRRVMYRCQAVRRPHGNPV